MKAFLNIVICLFPCLMLAQVPDPAFNRTIREFEVIEEMHPETVISSPDWRIKDFAFQGDNILVLTYDKKPENCVLRRLTLDNVELESKIIEEESYGFFEDVFHQVFLETKENVYYISSIPGMHFEKVKEEIFYSMIRPTAAKLDSAFISSTWHPKRPDFNYLIKSSYGIDTLKEIRDPHLYDLYYSEYRFLPFPTQCAIKRRSRETGESKYDIAAQWSGFTNSLWWRELYSPAIKMDDSLFLADHYKDSLYVFDSGGNRVRAIEINFHKQKGYDKELLYDEFTSTWYARFFRNGVTRLHRLNHFGEIEGEPMRLSYRYVEKIKLYQGKAFYLYRPFESTQNTFLYSEVLPARLSLANK